MTASSDPRAERAVAAAYRRLLPLPADLEPRLAGVLRDTLGRPGGLLRSRLAFAVLSRHGQPTEAALRAATAVEYFHTASLLFDDLPAMDDAATRRGAPCVHRRWGDGAAILGALALVNRGYQLAWQAIDGLPAARRRGAAALLAECLGVGGVLDGQARDLYGGAGGAGEVEPEIGRVIAGKTVTLLRLALVLPAWIVGLEARDRRRLDGLATDWGFAYQVLDDLDDRRQDDAAGGRPSLAAAIGETATLARLDGWLARARRRVERLGGEATLVAVQERLEAGRRALRPRLEAAA